MADVDEGLIDVLARAREVGDLGDRPIPEVVEHSRHFVRALDGVTGRVLDLGAGGGVPGLVVAHDRPDLEVVLLDRRRSRTDALERAVRRLGWGDRVSVVSADAANHVIESREFYDGVVARGFGPPAVTLTAASAAVTAGGRIVISEPPHDENRWDDGLLRSLGVVRLPSDREVAVFRRSP